MPFPTSYTTSFGGIFPRLTDLQLNALADVFAETPVDGDTLVFDAVRGKWVTSSNGGSSGSSSSVQSASKLASPLITDDSTVYSAETVVSGGVVRRNASGADCEDMLPAVSTILEAWPTATSGSIVRFSIVNEARVGTISVVPGTSGVKIPVEITIAPSSAKELMLVVAEGGLTLVPMA